MTEERPTPETDAVDGKPTWQENIIEKGWVPADFARRLERERDEARERADTMFGKHAEILDQYRRERDAERALADRLADALRELCNTFKWKRDITEESLNKAERVMADWVIAFVHRDRDQHGGQPIDSDCDCAEGEYLEPIDAALAAWKEARND